MGRYCAHLHVVGGCPSCRFEGLAIEDTQNVGITVRSLALPCSVACCLRLCLGGVHA